MHNSEHLLKIDNTKSLSHKHTQPQSFTTYSISKNNHLIEQHKRTCFLKSLTHDEHFPMPADGHCKLLYDHLFALCHGMIGPPQSGQIEPQGFGVFDDFYLPLYHFPQLEKKKTTPNMQNTQTSAILSILISGF